MDLVIFGLLTTAANPTTPHEALMWIICIAVSLFFILALLLTGRYWSGSPAPVSLAAASPAAALTTSSKAAPTRATYGTERAEKSCDAVLSVCTLLIPATLGLLTWLQEKIGPGNYRIPLVFALIYFFALLVFTTFLRFNFLWRFEKEFAVSRAANMSFAYWLTTAMCSIVLGIGLVAIPVLELGFGQLRLKESEMKDTTAKVECRCEPAQITVSPTQQPAPKPVRHLRRGTSCCCSTKNSK